MGHLARAVDGGDIAQGAAFGRNPLETLARGSQVDPIVRPPSDTERRTGR